jgi:hypothetical protein
VRRALLVALAVVVSSCRPGPTHPSSYRLSSGKVVRCWVLHNYENGIYLSGCEDGSTYEAQTNVEVLPEEGR